MTHVTHVLQSASGPKLPKLRAEQVRHHAASYGTRNLRESLHITATDSAKLKVVFVKHVHRAVSSQFSWSLLIGLAIACWLFGVVLKVVAVVAVIIFLCLLVFRPLATLTFVLGITAFLSVTLPVIWLVRNAPGRYVVIALVLWGFYVLFFKKKKRSPTTPQLAISADSHPSTEGDLNANRNDRHP